MAGKTRDSQGRRWLLTENNPEAHGMTNEIVARNLAALGVTYACGADERGKQGTKHTHIYFERDNSIRQSTIKRLFPTAHIDRVCGTRWENRNYITKNGEKWENDPKKGTNIEGSFWEIGDPGTETSNTKQNDIDKLAEMLREGKKNAQIITELPRFALRLNAVEIMRAAILEEAFAVKTRDVTVTYIYGATGTGKTSGIFAKHDIEDIYRVTNYREGKGIYFDQYCAQPVLVFEEFDSRRVSIEAMLNYLDVYPIKLPARYSDKQACFTQVYITSNTPLYLQYTDVQQDRPETWRAFLRRIHKIVEYHADGTIESSIVTPKPVLENNKEDENAN